MSTATEQGDQAAAAAVHAAFPEHTGEPLGFRGDWRVPVAPEHEAEVITHARDELGFTLLVDRLGADRGVRADPRFDVITVLYNLDTHRRLIFVASVSGETPRLPTLCGVFRGANWFEREAYDMYGVEFVGHPRLERILMPDGFDAHPLRKDYPMEGRGDWAAPRRALGGNVDGTDGHVAVPAHPGQPGPPTHDPLLATEELASDEGTEDERAGREARKEPRS